EPGAPSRSATRSPAASPSHGLATRCWCSCARRRIRPGTRRPTSRPSSPPAPDPPAPGPTPGKKETIVSTTTSPVVPTSTYRLQLHEGFTADDAAALVPYLSRLGVGHVFCSPVLQAA